MRFLAFLRLFAPSVERLFTPRGGINHDAKGRPMTFQMPGHE